MDVWTTFTREDYTRVLVEQFGLERAHVERFYEHLRGMNFYDNNTETTGEMLERFFPGRNDVKRLLMEPIAYANGSDPRRPGDHLRHRLLQLHGLRASTPSAADRTC